MSVKKAPGSYTERANNVRTISDLPSTSVGGVIGQVVRGIPNKAIKVTSWTQFQEKFAKGITDPFAVGNVADAVYGFFLNGGTELYVVRTLESGSAKAEVLIPSETGVKYSAKEEGKWGNDLAINITEVNLSKSPTYTLTVTMKGAKVEEIKNLTKDNVVEIVNSTSKFISIDPSTIEHFAVGNGALEGGTETPQNSATYKKGLSCFDAIEDINILAIPGITEEGVQEGLAEYCDTRGTIFPVLDAPSNATNEEVMEFKDKFNTFLGALYFPRIQVQNPMTGANKFVYPSGHIMGAYARTDATRGIQKAPAGTKATLKGAIAVERTLSEVEIGILNDYEINCIVPKRGCGIVIWGARLLKSDAERSYVSDVRLDMFVEQAIAQNTLWAVFEPKDEQLFNDLEAQISGLMINLWTEGKFLGKTKEEAFFVNCNSDLNPDVLSSELIIEVGYAKKRPAEFVTTRIYHKQ